MRRESHFFLVLFFILSSHTISTHVMHISNLTFIFFFSRSLTNSLNCVIINKNLPTNRYNLFIVLYVIGVFLGEEVLMLQSPNNYLPIDKQNVLFFYFTKFWMFSTMLGFVVLYRYMFSARAEFYRKLNNKKDESDKPAETKDSTHNEKVKKEQ